MSEREDPMADRPDGDTPEGAGSGGEATPSSTAGGPERDLGTDQRPPEGSGVPPIGGESLAPPPDRPTRPTLAAQSRRLLGGLLVPALAVLSGLVIGAFIIILSDPEFFRRLGTDGIGALGYGLDSVLNAYGALFSGSIGDPGRIAGAVVSGDSQQIQRALTPISETLLSCDAAHLHRPLGRARLPSRPVQHRRRGPALPWRDLSPCSSASRSPACRSFIHLPLAIAAGFVGGALWGFIPGILKARTGAHEVIVTIMLNYVAYRLVDFAAQELALPARGASDPISKFVAESAPRCRRSSTACG